jgi:dUTP pyrophosphatase
MTLDTGNYVTVPTGIRAIMDSGYFLMLVPRSGLGFKYRLRLSNTVGIVDSDYSNSDNEGHIFIKIVNEGNKQIKIETGDGFAQGIFVPFGLTKDDSVTDDRNGGFGSTDESVIEDILSGFGNLEPLDVVAKKVVEDVETVNAERNEEVKESNE